jgi:V8-like Glu-specific endopeptidase
LKLKKSSAILSFYINDSRNTIASICVTEQLDNQHGTNQFPIDKNDDTNSKAVHVHSYPVPRSVKQQMHVESARFLLIDIGILEVTYISE